MKTDETLGKLQRNLGIFQVKLGGSATKRQADLARQMMRFHMPMLESSDIGHFFLFSTSYCFYFHMLNARFLDLHVSQDVLRTTAGDISGRRA